MTTKAFARRQSTLTRLSYPPQVVGVCRGGRTSCSGGIPPSVLAFLDDVLGRIQALVDTIEASIKLQQQNTPTKTLVDALDQHAILREVIAITTSFKNPSANPYCSSVAALQCLANSATCQDGTNKRCIPRAVNPDVTPYKNTCHSYSVTEPYPVESAGAVEERSRCVGRTGTCWGGA